MTNSSETSKNFKTVQTAYRPFCLPHTQRVTFEQTLTFLKEHDQYLLCCHAHPDGDTLGSALALQRMLRQMGKQAQIVCPSPVPQMLQCLLDGTNIGAVLPEDPRCCNQSHL